MYAVKEMRVDMCVHFEINQLPFFSLCVVSTLKLHINI